MDIFVNIVYIQDYLPAAFENPNLIPKILRKQERQEDFANNSPEAIHPTILRTTR